MTSASSLTNSVNRLALPGVMRYYEFPEWRFSPTDQVLLFNFKEHLEREEEGIAIIAERFGKENIAGARRLCHSHFSKRQWLVIEVLFASALVRREALRYGVCYNNKQYWAFTTCNQRSSCTAISIVGMPIQKQEEALKFAKQRVEVLLEKYIPMTDQSSNGNSDHKGCSSETTLVLRHVWLHTNNVGIYNGSATVILDGYNPSLKEKKSGAMARYTDAVSYPLMGMFIRHCRMCCSNCRTLNHHTTEDCVGEQPHNGVDGEENVDSCTSPVHNDDDNKSTVSSTYSCASVDEASYDMIDPF